jgi:hypothetical protein
MSVGTKVTKLVEFRHKMNKRTCEEGAILNSGLEWCTVNIQLTESKGLSFVEMLCRTMAFVKARVAAGKGRNASRNTFSQQTLKITIQTLDKDIIRTCHQANLTIYQKGAYYPGIKIFNNLPLEINPYPANVENRVNS